LGYGLGWAKEACIRLLDRAQIPHMKGQLLGERTCTGMPDDTLL